MLVGQHLVIARLRTVAALSDIADPALLAWRARLLALLVLTEVTAFGATLSRGSMHDDWHVYLAMLVVAALASASHLYFLFKVTHQ